MTPKFDTLLIDGKHMLWRAADANDGLRAGDFQTGAMYGFLTILCRTQLTFGGSVIIAWDDWKDGPAKRKAMYPDYKRRDASPSALVDQRAEFIKSMNVQHQQLMKILEVFGIFQAYSPGWEADDVLGTLSRKFGSNLGIVSGDRDLLQCVTESVNLIRPQPKGEFSIETPEKVRADWGVTVEQFIDLKALMGDQGDNIPGCPGIGKKTAAKVLQSYKTLADAQVAAEGKTGWLLADGVRQKIAANRAGIELSRRLSEINCSVPVRFRPRTPDKKRALELMMKLQFRTILHGGRFEQLMSFGG